MCLLQWVMDSGQPAEFQEKVGQHKPRHRNQESDSLTELGLKSQQNECWGKEEQEQHWYRGCRREISWMRMRGKHRPRAWVLQESQPDMELRGQHYPFEFESSPVTVVKGGTSQT